MAMEQFIGAKAKKAWRMKPKARAGASIDNPQGGRSSDAKLKTKTQKAPEKTDGGKNGKKK